MGDGWITIADAVPHPPEVANAYRSGARDAGKDPATLPMLVELYAVVGDREEALEAARLWQFGPLMGDLISVADPRVIQQRVEEMGSPERATESWVVSPDPASHVQRINALFEAGAAQVYVHSPQGDQRKVIEFYGREVLPAIDRSLT